jgi:membrane protein DedA with SNARE-associated domain
MEAATDRFVLFLVPHLYLTVFAVSAIDAIGIPFPGRIMLVLAGAFASTRLELALAIVASALGSLAGDHVVYLAGARGGEALLALYCRLTLGSERCVENTLKYFRRFGAAAIVLGRYSTGVRLFAAILSGSGHFAYRRFVLYDLAGSLAYATV